LCNISSHQIHLKSKLPEFDFTNNSRNTQQVVLYHTSKKGDRISVITQSIIIISHHYTNRLSTEQTHLMLAGTLLMFVFMFVSMLVGTALQILTHEIFADFLQ